MDQSLSLNRRRDDEGEVKTEDLELDRVGLENDNDISQYYETISIHTESSQTNVPKGKTSDSITRIYACATMWHETKSEMMEMLKSLFRYCSSPSLNQSLSKVNRIRLGTPEIVNKGRFNQRCLDEITTPPKFSG